MQVGSKGWSVIGAGLGRIYRQGRDALDSVRRTPTDAAFHEWRKQAKYLRHQVQLLRPIQPKSLAQMEKQLHELSNHLGDDHDLAVLRVKLAGQPARRAAETPQRQITSKINRRGLSLQHKALQLGSRIYQEPPAEFCHRVRGYWHNWRSG